MTHLSNPMPTSPATGDPDGWVALASLVLGYRPLHLVVAALALLVVAVIAVQVIALTLHNRAHNRARAARRRSSAGWLDPGLDGPGWYNPPTAPDLMAALPAQRGGRE